jgi:hypothetical protein
VLWVAFAISSLLTTLTVFQSPGTEYLIHYGLLFHYTVVALKIRNAGRDPSIRGEV